MPRPPSSSPPRTPTQNKIIWVLVTQLAGRMGDRDDAMAILREKVQAVSGQESTKTLTVEQAGQVIDALQAVLTPNVANQRRKWHNPGEASSSSPSEKATGGAEVITAAQLEAIDKLRCTLQMDIPGYRAFVGRTLKRPWPQTMADGSAVYEGLEAMLRRRYPAAVVDGLARAVLATANVSQEDASFAHSIVVRIEKKKRLGAAHIGIMLKIGERYGFVPALPDHPGSREDPAAQ